MCDEIKQYFRRWNSHGREDLETGNLLCCSNDQNNTRTRMCSCTMIMIYIAIVVLFMSLILVQLSLSMAILTLNPYDSCFKDYSTNSTYVTPNTTLVFSQEKYFVIRSTAVSVLSNSIGLLACLALHLIASFCFRRWHSLTFASTMAAINSISAFVALVASDSKPDCDLVLSLIYLNFIVAVVAIMVSTVTAVIDKQLQEDAKSTFGFSYKDDNAEEMGNVNKAN